MLQDNNPKYDEDLLSIRQLPIYVKSENKDLNLDFRNMDNPQTHNWQYLDDGSQTESSSHRKNDPAKSNIVIHVCDETKNVKQDFNCPRDILISEMKYFSDYFTSNVEKWEDVDISVHCDVLIFDWLMKYVKQYLPPENKGKERERPKLEPSNVISILISSDFLKMSALVDECIFFCYQNMSAIIAIPCNMNCINDKLVSRIAKLFSHNEVEMIKDKKDKFKGKLFCKKIEDLFSPKFRNKKCPSNASTLFKCSHCEKLLTSESHSKVECNAERTLIDSRGNLSYSHAPDVSWDVNDHVINLKNQLKTWRNVFWRLWGTVNYLHCSRCDEMFPCTEFGNCSFHPMKSVFNADELEENAGNLNGDKIDANTNNSGCSFRDHQVDLKNSNNNELDKSSLNTQCVLDQLIACRDVICIPPKQAKLRPDDVYISSILSQSLMAPPHIITSHVSNARKADLKQHMQTARVEHSRSSYRRQKKAKFPTPKYDDDEDQSDPEEQAVVRVIINQSKRSRRNTESKSSSTWDANLPTRLNQDLQRESDLKRMNELLTSLVKCRIDENSKSESSQSTDSSELIAGTYCKFEQQLRASVMASKVQTSSSTSTSSGSRQSRFSSSKPG
eukprot:gene13889-15337_t